MSLPQRGIDMYGDRVFSDAMGNRWNIRITLTPDIEVGDVVLIHAGYAITKVDEEEAKKTWELFEEIAHFEAERLKAKQQEGDRDA